VSVFVLFEVLATKLTNVADQVFVNAVVRVRVHFFLVAQLDIGSQDFGYLD
jgi:hypothetical protein